MKAHLPRRSLAATMLLLLIPACGGDGVDTQVVIERISVSADGGDPDGDSGGPDISGNGGYIAFLSSASNLVASDTNGFRDIFVRDVAQGVTTRVSVASDGTEGDGHAGVFPSISADGSLVAFSSEATNLVANDNNNSLDVFVHDLETGETTRVSVSSTGDEGDQGSYFPSISEDGLFVAFSSTASNLVPNDTNIRDVFIHDLTTHETVRVSERAGGGTSDGGSHTFPESISADGKRVAFVSIATNLVSDDTNAGWDVFIHDTATGTTGRINVTSAGEQTGSIWPFPGPAPFVRKVAISADGDTVAFISEAGDLVDGDTNQLPDAFVHKMTTGETTRVSVSDDGEEADRGADEVSVGGGGDAIAFSSSSTNLVSGDDDGVANVFVRYREQLRAVPIPDSIPANALGIGNMSLMLESYPVVFSGGFVEPGTGRIGRFDVFIQFLQ
jgi:hypothetical protein